MSKSTLTQLDPRSEAFRRWLQTPGFRKPRGTVLHHTWRPDEKQYAGRPTIANIRSFHMKPKSQGGRGVSDIMANAYACPDRTVFTGRPLDTGNWAHAYISRTHPEPEAWAFCGYNRSFPNHCLFGLETVADFDRGDPYGRGLAGVAYECALQTLAAVHKLFGLPASSLFFHRDFADKSCPGDKLSRSRVRQDLADLLGEGPREPAIVLCLPGAQGLVVDCEPEMVGERMTCRAEPLLDALGVRATALPGYVIHANGRAFVGELRDALAEQWTLDYRNQPQGPRVYVKPVEVTK